MNEDKDVYCIALGSADEPVFECDLVEAVNRLKKGEKVDALYIGLPYDETVTPAAFLETFGKKKKVAKTGGGGAPWVDLEPKPPRVEDHYEFWGEAPPEQSERCTYWVRQIERGFRPNRRITGECYDCSAEWYGIYIWEYLNVISPLLHGSGK